MQVLDATHDGALHVKGWGVGTGSYAVHVFRTCAEWRGGESDDTEVTHSSGWLFKTARARKPLQWRAVDPSAAAALWRRMTGRQEPASREEAIAKALGKKP